MAQEAKMLARDHKNTLRFFCKRQNDPWWGPSGPMAADRRRPRLCAGVVLFCPFAGKNIVMVDDDTLVELLRRFLRDPRTSDAEIRRLSRLALLRYEDFRLQLVAWSLNPPASSQPNSAANFAVTVPRAGPSQRSSRPARMHRVPRALHRRTVRRSAGLEAALH